MGLRDAIRKATDKLFNKKLKESKVKIKHALSTDFVEMYMSAFDKKYDALFIAPYKMHKDDQTAPAKIKDAVMSYIRSELVSKIGKLSVDDENFTLRAIERQAFGYPDGPDNATTDPLKLFYFYLEGTVGEFVFISQETYEKIKPGSKTRFGRYGTGFLMPMKEYRGKYKSAIARGIKGVPSPESVRHPFSGAPPVPIFDEVKRAMGGRKGIVNFFKKIFGK